VSFFIFLFLCFVSVAVGIGTLHSLGCRKHNDPIFLSSPLIALCIWALILGIGVSLRVPVRILTYVTWGISLVLCLVTFKFYRYPKLFSPLLACAGIALLISLPYVIHGFSNYTGSPFPDGWAYVAFGQYLWEYPRCAEGGLAPLYQFASRLCRSRFVAASLLGFISPLVGWPGDTQAASGYFLPWAFFVYASSCAFFIWKRVSKFFVWGYVILCVVSGLLFTVMSGNNFDQALAIGFLPAIAGILESVNFAEKRWAALLAIVLSSSVYVYPELAPFIFLSAFLILIFRLTQDKTPVASWFRLGAVFLLLFGMMVSVYSPTWFNFIRSQFSALQMANRPGGGIASELTSQKYWFLGLWQLGGRIRTMKPVVAFALDWIRYFGAFILTSYFLVGFVTLVQHKKIWLTTVQITLGVFVTYLLLVEQYAYGAYKVISLLWWLVSFTIVLAAQRLQKNSASGLIWIGSKYAFVCALGIMICVTLIREQQLGEIIRIKDIAPYRELQTIQPLLHNSPVGISVIDPTASLWAMYYLRESSTYFFSYHSYPDQAHVRPGMSRSQPVDLNEIKYLLTDAKDFQPENADLVWHNSVYSLWKIKAPPCFITKIENPNGLEVLNGRLFFWLSNEATRIHFYAFRAGQVELLADYMPGPSSPELIQWKLSLRTDSGIADEVLIHKDFRIRILARQGHNEITVQSLDQPTVFKFPSGEERIILLGLSNLRLAYRSEKP
jgi:hypothetical protein